MPATKDPWLAVNLSWTAAGLGPLYAGRKKAGAILLALEALLWALLLGWALVPQLSFWTMVGAQVALLVLWITSGVVSARMIRREFPPEEGAKTPWKSVFITRFVPGAGHMYAGHWVRGLLFAGLMLVLLFWPVRESLDLWKTAAFYAARLLLLFDAFRILRQRNAASAAWTGFALVALLIGSQTWLVAVGLKTFVVEVYRIPSSSMEPALLGDVADNHSKSGCPFAAYHVDNAGDRILVSKLSYVASSPRRFDVAVFKFPLNQSKNFVKRVVGLPDEELMIHAGDLYVRPKGGSRFEIVRKPLEVQDRIWIRMHADEDSAADVATFNTYWETGGGTVSSGPAGGVKVPGSVKRAEFRPEIDDGWGNPIADVRVSMDVRMDFAADLFLRLANPHGTLELMFPVGRPGRLSLTRAGKEIRTEVLSPTLLSGGRWHSLELMMYDGQAVVRLDEEVLGQVPLVTSLEEAKSLPPAPTRVSFSAPGQDGVFVRRVRVGRDIHFRGKDNREFGLREDEPLAIPANQYVCFGDNVTNAHDSRAWVKRTFVLKDGRKIVCESQQVNEAYSRYTRMLQQRLGLPEPPRYAIDGDEHGDEVAITDEQLLREEEPQPFRFVDRRFFVGRVAKIWWPPARQGPVR